MQGKIRKEEEKGCKEMLTSEEIRNLVQNALVGSINSIVRKLDPFTGDPSKDMMRWLEDFECYANVSGWSSSLKANKLPLYIWEDAREWHTINSRKLLGTEEE